MIKSIVNKDTGEIISVETEDPINSKTPMGTLIRLSKWMRDYIKTQDKPFLGDFDLSEQFIFLCNVIPQPDHCMIIRLVDRKVYGPFHNEDFEPIPEEDL